jgi:hypothetical protein
MKKVIRLTESDLSRIVRRVIKEQESQSTPEGPTLEYFKKNPKGSLTSYFAFVKSVNNDFKQLELHPNFFSELRTDNPNELNSKLPEEEIEWNYELALGERKINVKPKKLNLSAKYWFYIKK